MHAPEVLVEHAELVRLAARQWGVLAVRLVDTGGEGLVFVVASSPTVCEQGAERFADELADALGVSVDAHDVGDAPAGLLALPSTRLV